MKRSLTLLLVSLLVVLGLTACGGDDNKQEGSGSAVVDGSAGSSSPESSTGQENRPENGSTDHAPRPDDGDSLMEDAEQGVKKAVRGAESSSPESSTGQENRPENGSTDHAPRPDDGDSLMEDAEQGVKKAVRGAEDLVDDAMRGARTKDRNGDLTDLENGVARNSTR